MKTYKIIRFYQDDTPSRIMQTGLDLETAKMHCQDATTRGKTKDGVMWFEGFTEE
jgi:hypothetical protein